MATSLLGLYPLKIHNEKASNYIGLIQLACAFLWCRCQYQLKF